MTNFDPTPCLSGTWVVGTLYEGPGLLSWPLGGDLARTCSALGFEYALCIIGYLHAQGPRPGLARCIAEATGIPLNMVTKSLQAMGRQGLSSSVQGKQGGYTLTPGIMAMNLGG